MTDYQDIDLIYEDNHLLVVDKPVNMPCQEDASGDPDLLNEVKEYIRVKYDKPGRVYLGLVHRLDRPTGGLMVFAKTSKAASRLSETIRKGNMERTYLAVLQGNHLPQRGRFEDYLYKDQANNQVFVVEEGTPKAKYASLTYQVLEVKKDLSLIQVQLQTGRSHQIRVQFASRGCPLWGDQKYGSHFSQPGQDLALYASSLTFPHVTKRDKRTFTSQPQQASQREPWAYFDYFHKD